MNYRTVHHGLKIVELPIHFADRRDGREQDERQGAAGVGDDAASLRRRAALAGTRLSPTRTWPRQGIRPGQRPDSGGGGRVRPGR